MSGRVPLAIVRLVWLSPALLDMCDGSTGASICCLSWKIIAQALRKNIMASAHRCAGIYFRPMISQHC